MQTLTTDDGVEFAYLDSGAPDEDALIYPTLFVIHGTVFTNHIFEKVLAAAKTSNTRVVAISRREYPGSTPLSADDNRVLTAGTDAKRSGFMHARGAELATFIDKFVTSHGTRQYDATASTGGFALVGWSLGCAYACAALAALDALPAEAQDRWHANMRSLILFEAPPASLGMPSPPGTWTPATDDSIPLADKTPFFAQWLTAYFAHADVTSRDPDALAHITPDPLRVPSIYSIARAGLGRLTHEPPAMGSEMLVMVFLGRQLAEGYRKACFGEVRERMPGVKVWALCGDSTASFGVQAMWAIEDDDKASGGGFVKTRWIAGGNHLLHWDRPDEALRMWLECL